MVEFMFSKITQEKLNNLLGVGPINFSNEFGKPHAILIYEFPDVNYSIP